ncbi:MAG: hypothetical protein NT099_02115 [Candidatus Saganbacteria bacterium]|nr:hypothetical protein [Candidatus Saganbacteria bacterium]
MGVFAQTMHQAGYVGEMSGRWHAFLRNHDRQEVSLREMLGLRQRKTTVIAVGGNSVDGAEMETADNIVKFRAPVVTHGNGPQVGKVSLANPEWSLARCVEQTQYEIGATLTRELQAAASRAGRTIEVLVVPTRVIVDPKDPAFSNPTKGIGLFYSEDEMRAMGPLEEKGDGWHYLSSKDWHIKKVGNPKDESKPWRRVVGSPKPLAIHPEDLQAIKDGIAAGKTVIACGGGGVSGYFKEGKFVEIDSVIDKDFASALLAMELRAREMIISTGVKRVAHNFGKPNQVDIAYYVAGDAVEGILDGQYKVGQMKEKVEAGVNAVRDGVNVVVITEPGANWLSMVQDPISAEGTLITRGPDPKGRLRGIGKQLGNLAEAITGSRLIFPDRLQRWQVTGQK